MAKDEAGGSKMDIELPQREKGYGSEILRTAEPPPTRPRRR